MLSRPETTPWALSDGEVYSVYKALGGSSDLLSAGSLGSAALQEFVPPAQLLTWALGLAAFQQNRMRTLYESELRRRGLLRDPEATTAKEVR